MEVLISRLRTSSLVTAVAPYLALFAAMLAFACGTSMAKGLFPQIGAEATAAYRVGFSALVLVLVFRPWRTRLSRADLVKVALYGAAMGLMNLTFYMALRTIPLGLAIAIEFMGPLALSLSLARKPIHFLAVGLALGGLALLLPIRGGAGALDPVGVGFAFAAAAFWALYIVFGKRIGHLPGGQGVALGMVMAALVVVPIGVHAAGPAFFNGHLVLLGLTVAVISSALPYSLEMVALKRIPARNFGILLSADPAVGAVIGLILLGEQLNLGQWFAVSLVVAASALSVVAPTRPETPAA